MDCRKCATDEADDEKTQLCNCCRAFLQDLRSNRLFAGDGLFTTSTGIIELARTRAEHNSS